MAERSRRGRPGKMQCAEIRGGTGPADSWFSVPGLDVDILSQPYAGQSAGGDIHLLSLCNAGRLSRFVIADAAGHGADARGLAERLRELMAQHANEADQTRFIQRLNRDLAGIGKTGQFATALAVSYLYAQHHLLLCNAGHPRPLRYHAAEGHWELLHHELPDAVEAEGINLPLGIIAQTDYYQFAVELTEGDIVLLYTDSLTDVRTDGRSLGERGLLEVVRQLDPARPADLPGELLSALRQRGASPVDQDDVTLVTLYHHGRGPDVSMQPR
ncbi:MAG: PP2C family protein-serine/threonine phosphatase [Planctomycetota bacterium]